MNKQYSDDLHSLSHTKWRCKYHIVFAPKYRRRAFYEARRVEVGAILRQLCEWKGVNIIEAEVCIDHVHMLVEILTVNVCSFSPPDRSCTYVSRNTAQI